MDITCPPRDIRQTLSLICTNIGAAADLSDIDITTWIGKDVAASCTDDTIKLQNEHFGLCSKTAHRNSISDVQMYLYTNPCLLDREELFAYMMDAVGRRDTQSSDTVSPENVEQDSGEHLSPLILEQKEKFRMHHRGLIERDNAKHMLRLQKNKDLLRQMLMPQTLSTRFLFEMHHNICRLLSLLVVEESLHKMREIIVTVPPMFYHTTEDLVRLTYINEQSVHIESFANSILAEALNAFLPPHYACWDKTNPLSHSMHPLIDCYARTDACRVNDHVWHDKLKAAYTMEDYIKLMRVEDILVAMVAKGDNIVPVLSQADHSIENDVPFLRFIMCVLFLIHVCNKSERFGKPLFFTRLDNAANIIFNVRSTMSIYNIKPGQMFCHGGYIYIRPPGMQPAGVIIRSKCILSLHLRLCEGLER